MQAWTKILHSDGSLNQITCQFLPTPALNAFQRNLHCRRLIIENEPYALDGYRPFTGFEIGGGMEDMTVLTELRVMVPLWVASNTWKTCRICRGSP